MGKKKEVKHPTPWTYDMRMDSRGSVEARIIDKDGHMVTTLWDDWPEDTELLAKRVCRAMNKADTTAQQAAKSKVE